MENGRSPLLSLSVCEGAEMMEGAAAAAAGRGTESWSAVWWWFPAPSCSVLNSTAGVVEKNIAHVNL